MESKSSGRRIESEHSTKLTASVDISLSMDRMERKRHHSSLSDSKEEEREESYIKKPHLTVDTSPNCQPLCEALSSNDSFYSGVAESDGVPMASGLSAYLEDIVSDEEPLEEPPPPSSPQSSKGPPASDPVRGKEELLQLMERVDREITSTEQQITVLEKRQEENSTISLTTTISSITTPSLTSAPPTSLINSSSSSVIASSVTSVSFTDHTHFSPSIHQQKTTDKRSVVDIVYNENRLKALNSQIAMFGPNNNKLGMGPLYYQPSDTEQFLRNKESHKVFLPKLVSYLKKKKIEKYRKELALCEEYESVYADWEKRIERWTQSIKKKNRDSRSKELFEKAFPELRSKRDQLRDEAHSRVGVRSFGVVRSEAELNQLAYELYEQDEAKGRWQLTHAVLPPMLIEKREREVQFINNNGLISDPMAVHRLTKTAHSWSDEEKAIFKDKFAQFPKNFEKISSFLPNKSMNECIRYYYLVKKKENFKQLIRRSSFKRRRLSKHHSSYPMNSGLHSSSLLGKAKPRLSSSDGGHSSAAPSVLTSPTSLPPVSIKSPPRVPDYDGWTEKEISSLKEGLCKYGRAWGKVYREVGGGKSATQCKQFYDTYCTDQQLQLNSALAEHSSKKNAEKVKKKMAEIKKASTLSSPVTVTKKVDKKPHPLTHPLAAQEGGESEEDSDGTETEDEDEDESDSETTLTDSGSEETKTKDFKPLRFSSSSVDQVNSESLQSPLDIFLSAAEALSNTVPVEIALHDHTYSRPPMDLQGSSGLQLIAAAAAVVSPGLAKTAGSSGSKSTGFSITNKAPRGRPPSQQKRGSGYTHQKLAPTFLTPTSGTSHNISLDLKPTLRARSRSAPTDKLRPQIPLTAGKNLVAYPQPSVSKSHITPTVRGGAVMAGKDINLIATSGILRSSSSPSSSTASSSSSLIGVANGHLNSIDNVSSTASPVIHQHLLTHTSSDGTSRLSYPLVSSSSASKSHQRRDGPVLELNLGNLGNMALLLAATGSNQQAAFLLPPSTILNKQTLAMLQGGSVCLSDSGAATTTFSIDTSSLTSNGSGGRLVKADPKELTSLSVGKGGVILSTTPTSSLPKDLSTSVKGSVPLHLSAPLNVKDASTGISARSLSTVIIKDNNITTSTAAINSSVHVNTCAVTNSTHSDLVPSSGASNVFKQDGPRDLTTPTSTPTSPGDFSNLNLLSNLVAGLSKKPDQTPQSASATVTTPTTPPIKPNVLNFRKMDNKLDHHKPTETNSHRLPPPTSSTYQTISSQQSLMLYARSLSMPLNSSTTSSPEEVDSLEYATRGISELSKLLGGTDNGIDAPPTSSKVTSWSPDELLCNPFGNQGTPTSVHTITTSLTAATTDLLVPPSRQLSLSNRTPTPINALAEEKS